MTTIGLREGNRFAAMALAAAVLNVGTPYGVVRRQPKPRKKTDRTRNKIAAASRKRNR